MVRVFNGTNGTHTLCNSPPSTGSSEKENKIDPDEPFALLSAKISLSVTGHKKSPDWISINQTD